MSLEHEESAASAQRANPSPSESSSGAGEGGEFSSRVRVREDLLSAGSRKLDSPNPHAPSPALEDSGTLSRALEDFWGSLGEGLVPASTYRIQHTPSFTLEHTADLADYLAQLGVSHLYASPYLQAAAGSTHGYDAVDHGRVNHELGGQPAHDRLVKALRQHGLGQVLDIVPNHMAITGRENAAWWDVLENGPASRFASYFDVDWVAPEAKLRNKVLLPILGDHYGRVLETGELKLSRAGGEFVLNYFDHELPVSLGSLEDLLRAGAAKSGSHELGFVADAVCALKPLPLREGLGEGSASPPQEQDETKREPAPVPSLRGRGSEDHTTVLHSLIERACDEPAVADALDSLIGRTNTDPDALDRILARQNYRLAHWRTASREINYRRFFDVSTLIGLRVEDEPVFTHSHKLVLGWLSEGVLDGVRIDHPDGLRDPGKYLDRLREAAPNAWITVEKILEREEHLPRDWPVAGTTGYDFLNRALGLYIDPRNEEAFTRLYAELTGESTDYPAIVREKKHLVVRKMFGGELNRLTQIFVEVCERNRRFRDFARHEIHEVLREGVVSFPVYRSYARPHESDAVSEADAHHINAAIDDAKRRRPDLDGELLDFFRDLLLLKVRGAPGSAPGIAEGELVLRFQQLTGPVMAKGVEDTTFYTFNRFVALNEVGGDPSRFGLADGVEEFHRENARTQEHWPHTMTALSTHDTKRSEDVRARLAVVSELPGEWERAVRGWFELNAKSRGDWCDPNAEYLLYQTLAGAWPISADRAAAYMAKATREAKTHTSWTEPNATYDKRLEAFVRAALADRAFVADLERFVQRLAGPGWITSLSQKLIQLTSPGVPDLYHGTELWDLSLVDPDNRRPVDFGVRRRLLNELPGLKSDRVLARMNEGLPKLLVVQRALRLRRERAGVFRDGGYTPLGVRGRKADCFVAFMRGDEAITITPRLVIELAGEWGDTSLELPPGLWRNEFSGDTVEGGSVRLANVLRRFPVALLSRSK